MSEPEAQMIQIPSVQREGVAAAILGTHMSALCSPQGFTFCPYGPSKPAERWNFLHGCVTAYFDDTPHDVKVA